MDRKSQGKLGHSCVEKPTKGHLVPKLTASGGKKKSGTYFLLGGKKRKERPLTLVNADGKVPESPLWEAN